MDNKIIPPPVANERNLLKILIVVFILIGFISAFAGGFFLKDLLKKETPVSIPNIPQQTSKPAGSKIPVPNIQNDADTTGQQTKFLPGKHYFDDTIIAVSKDKPYYSIVATVTRQEQNSNYSQISRVSFFNGNSWFRKTDSKSSPDSEIVANQLVRSWTTNIDSSRVLKENDNGEINIENSQIQFSTGPLQNEISIRSLPGYTKFLSKGDGFLTINGAKYPSYILYSRIYSLNSSDIQFYNQPFGLTTDWLIFWDSEGNMYHVDATEVENPTLIYQTHKIGILENNQGAVFKTFQLNITRDSSVPPNKYTITLANPVNVSFEFNLLDSINKAPDNSFKWYMGHVSGTVNKDGRAINGIGLVEYIHN